MKTGSLDLLLCDHAFDFASGAAQFNLNRLRDRSFVADQTDPSRMPGFDGREPDCRPLGDGVLTDRGPPDDI